MPFDELTNVQTPTGPSKGSEGAPEKPGGLMATAQVVATFFRRKRAQAQVTNKAPQTYVVLRCFDFDVIAYCFLGYFSVSRLSVLGVAVGVSCV